jgi:hypothetical protein
VAAPAERSNKMIDLILAVVTALGAIYDPGSGI